MEDMNQQNDNGQRVRPEPTQVKHLGGVPLKGRLLAMPTNFILSRKSLPDANTLAYNKIS